MTKIHTLSRKIPTLSTALEQQNVQKVYNKIAEHFSDTRYKPWPVIKQFLQSKPTGSLIADIGCGNGKYMHVDNDRLMYIGSDFSQGLARIAHDRFTGKHADVVVADTMTIPLRSRSCDHAISIAVIHHLTSVERRIQAIRELVRIVKPGGQVLIFVWAMEQSPGSRFRFTEQDVFVPWQLPTHNLLPANTAQEPTKPVEQDSGSGLTDATATVTTFDRYYHVFKQGELEDLVRNSHENDKVTIAQSGYDRDNWYVIIEKLKPLDQ